MHPSLDSLLKEIRDYLQSRGIVIFESFPRSGEATSAVFWDTEHHPDYREYVAAAEAAGVRMITLFSRQLEEELIEDAIDQLADATLDLEEARSIEARLKQIRGYVGFTCQIELSFELAARVYTFDLRTDWFEDLSDLADRIEESYEDEDEDDASISGGYFSRN